MQYTAVLDRLRKELDAIAAEDGLEIVELTLKPSGNRSILRLLIDKEGGIKLDECAAVNRKLGDIIEKEGLINEKYLLEVSSPGLDRPLKNKRDFEKHNGEEVDIWLNKPMMDKSFLNGKIGKAAEDDVAIIDKAGNEITVSYSTINKAKLKY
jgi:ribosome maturation factor RimP